MPPQHGRVEFNLIENAQLFLKKFQDYFLLYTFVVAFILKQNKMS